MTDDPLTLDVRGLACPLPVLRAKKALDRIEPGAVLTVRATDPGALRDFPTLCQQTGHQLLESGQEGDVYLFRIRRKA